jgi:Translation initiation factor eIF3 subunit
VEEADHGLTEDLFGGGSNSNSKDTAAAAAAAPAAGLDGIPLKTLQDHVKLALELGQKLSSSSKSPSIVALFKELLTLVEGKLSLEETNEVRLYSLTLLGYCNTVLCFSWFHFLSGSSPIQ